LTIFVDREGGVDLDTLGEATRAVSDTLDELDPLPGRYNPVRLQPRPGAPPSDSGPLRARHRGGRDVRIHGGTSDVRRVRGTIESADGSGFTLVGPDLPEGSLRVAYDEVERARTIFEWGPQPKRVRG